MLSRLALFLVLAVVVARAFWRLVDGILEGVTGKRPDGQVPARGVPMVRDPVCGTFVVPDQALTIESELGVRMNNFFIKTAVGALACLWLTGCGGFRATTFGGRQRRWLRERYRFSSMRSAMLLGRISNCRL